MKKSLLAGIDLPQDWRTEPAVPPAPTPAPQTVAEAKAALLVLWDKVPAEARILLSEYWSAPRDEQQPLLEKAWPLVPALLREPLLAALKAYGAACARKPEPAVERVPAYDSPSGVPAVASVPSPARADPSIPLPGQTPPSVPAREATAPTVEACSRPRNKGGRPRLYADRVLTKAERAKRVRQKRRAVALKARSGDADATTLSNADLCLAVTRMLNQRDDLDLRQIGLPLVRELQRRLKIL